MEIRTDMTDEEYFAYPALSQSTLKRYLESPRKAQKEKFKISPEAKAYGDALEVVLFEGIDALNLKYYKSEFATYCPSMTAEAAEINKKEVVLKKPLTKAHYASLVDILESLKHSPNAQKLINIPGQLQLVLIWEKDGIKYKAKLDKVIRGNGKLIILDAKSFAAKKTITDDSLSYHCKDYGYDIQAKFYTRGAVACGLAESEEDVVFINMFAEKSTNPEIICATISDTNLEKAGQKIDYGVQLYIEAKDKVITAEQLMLQKQNALTGDPSQFVTLSWFDNSVPEILL